LEDIFSGEQSSVAMSPDGARLYEMYEGTVKVFLDGDEETTFKLSSYNTTEELGYAHAIAASDNFLFVWAPNSDKDILVFDLDGKYVTKFELPRAGFGFSLSWANGMLWIAEDADGSSDGADGTWYGYELKGLE
jgi:sugar lactone lactonase YvrE